MGLVAALFPMEVIGLLGSSLGSTSLLPFFLKLIIDAHASMSVPPTVTCSAEFSLTSFPWRTTPSKKRPATSASISRSLLFEKVEASKLSSGILMSRKNRNIRS
nr:hypothetical protein [Vulgatibacter incomptus]